MLKIYGVSPSKPNACSWYRVLMPFRTAHRMRLSDTLIDWMDMKIPNEDVRRMHATVYADIVQHYQNYSPGFKYSRDEASNFPSYWETKEKWNFGPNFVYDTDDDMFNVEPLNPAFRNLGIVRLWPINDQLNDRWNMKANG